MTDSKANNDFEAMMNPSVETADVTGWSLEGRAVSYPGSIVARDDDDVADARLSGSAFHVRGHTWDALPVVRWSLAEAARPAAYFFALLEAFERNKTCEEIEAQTLYAPTPRRPHRFLAAKHGEEITSDVPPRIEPASSSSGTWAFDAVFQAAILDATPPGMTASWLLRLYRNDSLPGDRPSYVTLGDLAMTVHRHR